MFSERPSARLLAMVALTMVGIVAAPQPTHACGQCNCYDSGPALWPPFTRQATTNYRPLLVVEPGAPLDTLRVTNALGTPVDVELTSVRGDDRAYWMHATEGWHENSSYLVELEGVVLGSFETAAGQDVTPPTIGAVELDCGLAPGPMCTTVRGGTLVLRDTHDDRYGTMYALLHVAGQVSLHRASGASQASYYFGDGGADADCLGLAQLVLPGTGHLAATLELYDGSGNVTRVDGLELAGLGRIHQATCPGEGTIDWANIDRTGCEVTEPTSDEEPHDMGAAADAGADGGSGESDADGASSDGSASGGAASMAAPSDGDAEVTASSSSGDTGSQNGASTAARSHPESITAAPEAATQADDAGSSGGCTAVGGRGGVAGMWAFAAVAWLVRRRRRRSQDRVEHQAQELA